MSINVFKAMVAKLEKTGSLNNQSGRGLKSVAQGTIKDFASTIIDRAQDNIACTSRVCGVSRNMDIPWKILRKIIHFYPYKMNCLQKLRYTDHQKRLTFALTFLARMEVDADWPLKT